MKQVFRKNKPPVKILEKGEVKVGMTQVSKPKDLKPHPVEARRGQSGQPRKDVSGFRNSSLPEVMYLKCHRCNLVIPEYLVEQHLNDCQGGKAECGKCGKYFLAKDFVAHFKTCDGKKAENIQIKEEEKSE
jgi:hypothetical protein